MIIDHIGIAVLDINEGIKQWTDIFGYSLLTKPIVNTRQMVNVVFLEKNNSIIIKLISPLNEDSPIYRFTKRGGGLHHICFKVDDIHQGIESLQSKGLKMLAEAQPGEAFDNKLIAFLSARNGLNIELIDTDKKV